ncbi:MAG: CDP-alcohol phosphatidyltransferase family protein [Rhodococcus sp. (in: high G+C Gram-positive bacteria)]
MLRRRSPADHALDVTPLDVEGYLRRWSELHGSIDPSTSRLVDPWLRAMYAVGRPLVNRSVSPHTITVVGVAMAFGAVATSIPGTRWPLVAALLVLLSAALDGVDGAVAVIGRSESRWGYVLDTVADRCSDLCFLAVAWLLGAPPGLLVVTGALTLLHEGARARAIGTGAHNVGTLTVWERPSRVITALVITVGAGFAPSSSAFVALMGSVVGTALAAIGFVQLMVLLYRRLR